MKSHASAVIAAHGVLQEVRSGPPLTLRRVISEDRDTCRLCVVNSAAGPLSGDDVQLELRLGVDAHAELVAAGAAIAQGRGGGAPGRLSSQAYLAEGSRLIAEPAPVIVCAGSAVEINVKLSLAESAAVRWHEMLVLGRADEAGGCAVLRWNLTRADRPVLRSTVDLTDPELTRWPGMIADQRVICTAVISDPDYAATSAVLDATAVRQAIDAHTALFTVLDTDAAAAEKRLHALMELN